MNKLTFLVLLFCLSSALATVPVALKCPDGWKWFKRSRGGWCMKVYAESINIQDAEAKCKVEGAMVAGTQNLEEINWMVDTINTMKPSATSMWVGAKRTKACMAYSLTTTCTQFSSFYWTDGSVVGVSGFKWKAGEPNNALMQQDCAHLYLDIKEMDDIICAGTKLAGYACGKVAAF